MKHALLRTLPGRALVVGAGAKLLVFALALAVDLPTPIRFLDTTASVLLLSGGGYLLARGLALTQHRLLWRVRRKLIISYIFIGFIPAILIAAFFLLGALLLFSNFSSYLLQTRLRGLSAQSSALASAVAVEIQRAGGRAVPTIAARRQAAIAGDFAGASIAIVPFERSCETAEPGAPAEERRSGVELRRPVAVGPWDHMDPPRALPSWITCGGFQGLLAYADLAEPPPAHVGALTIDGGPAGRDVALLARGVAMPDSPNPRYAVVVDLLVNATVRDELRRETGVELSTVRTSSAAAPVLPARGPLAPLEPSSSIAALPGVSASFPEIVDWTSGTARSGSVVASMQLSIPEMYARMSAAQGSIGQGLLLVLTGIGMLFLVIEAVALAAGLALARSITGSVHELAEGTERIRRGDFGQRIAVRARDQLGELAESFNSMTASIENLLQEQAEKKRLEEELRIAHEIQMSLLPQGPLGFRGLSVTTLCVPAREVGGDYYDLLPLDEHRVGVLIADVSGKGTSAALYMAEMKGLVLSLSRIHTSPRALLIEANRIIAEHLSSRSFITMTYAVIDMQARTLTYARAGHTPLMCLPGRESPVQGLRLLAPDGLVLGLKIDNGSLFERLLTEETMPIHDGDLFLLFTDGITEAMNAADDCFGEARLGALVQEHADLPSDQLRERILREVAAFVGDAPQHDDMTLILLRIGDAAGTPASAGPVAALAHP
ncbi:MAG: PP2C family protein-serine/threonine phosphatase [Vicinamibacterales bacterium]